MSPAKIPLILLLLGTELLFSCRTGPKDNQYEPSAEQQGKSEQALSLAADRSHLDELRKEVPVQTKKENDDLAFLLQLFAQEDRKPADIRAEFDRVIRKRRETLDRDLRKERESFNKDEKSRREQFLKSQSSDRESFRARKSSREESNQFYRDQTDRRNEFFQVEREKRNDFESDVRERRKTFEDFVREKQNWFNQEHRAFVKKQDDKKAEAKKLNPTN